MGASGGSILDSSRAEFAHADIGAVLDHIECERAVLVGANYTGHRAITYADEYPDRVDALILINTFAYYGRDTDYPWGLPQDVLERLATSMVGLWESGASLQILAPSKAGDEAFGAWYSRSERLGLHPDHIAPLAMTSFTSDVRAMLGDLDVPTLVLHRAGDRHIRVEAGRYMADHIPGARYVELPGDDHLYFVGNTDALVDEIEEFLTGRRQAPEGDVITATILFTDIVASTEQSARSGHRKWTKLVDDHDAMVRAILARYRGHEVKTTGDGFLATFDATSRAVRAATDIVNRARAIGMEVRAGVHTGEVEFRVDDVVGLAVSIAKRVCDLARPGEVFVSDGVRSMLTGSGIATSDQGMHRLKGVPDEWRLYAVISSTAGKSLGR